MQIVEYIFVGVIVTGCAVFSAWRLMSARIRLRVLDGLSILPPAAGGGVIGLLRRRTLAKLSGGCGTCSQATHSLNASVQPLNRRPGAPRH